jgi:hypothetical protein
MHGPYRHLDPVTPNDSNNLSRGVTDALIVAVGGTLKVTLSDGSAYALTVPAGELHIAALRVWSTGTAATGITACYM